LLQVTALSKNKREKERKDGVRLNVKNLYAGFGEKNGKENSWISLEDKVGFYSE
jgi:hypothetical protein